MKLKKIHVDENFKQKLKISAAKKGISMVELTRKIAKENGNFLEHLEKEIGKPKKVIQNVKGFKF